MIEAYIITGPLGAGKSTALNHLLDALPDEAHPAVVTHHFAVSFGLETTPVKRRQHREQPRDGVHSRHPHARPHRQDGDDAAVAAAAARANVAFYEEVYDFGSGCVCCSPKGDFARVLWKLAAHSERLAGAGQAPVTHLLVETTGLGEPDVFAKVFFTDEAVAAAFTLRCVAAVVDPCTIGSLLSETPPPGLANKARQQLAAASVVVNNARRAAGATAGAASQGLAAAVMAATAGATVWDAGDRFARPGEASLGPSRASLWDVLLGASFDAAAAKARDASFFGEGPAAAPPLVQTSLALGRSNHDGRVVTLCCVETGKVVPEKFDRWLRGVHAAEGGGEVLRCKADVILRPRGVEASAAEAHCERDGKGATPGDTRMIADGVGNSIAWRTALPPPPHSVSSSTAPAADGPGVPLCGDSSCQVIEHKRGDEGVSRVFLAGKGLKAGKLRRGFRECFVPDGYYWAADVEVDFPLAGEAESAAPLSSNDLAIDVRIACGPGDSTGQGGKGEEEGCIELALWRVGGEFHAVSAKCPHAGGSLAQGKVLNMPVGDMEDTVGTVNTSAQADRGATQGAQLLLSCPRHFFTFDMLTGACVTAKCAALDVYPAEVILGSVYVQLTRAAGDRDRGAGIGVGSRKRGSEGMVEEHDESPVVDREPTIAIVDFAEDGTMRHVGSI